jgi:eukaryotic-like serine/threonine-protein kinase
MSQDMTMAMSQDRATIELQATLDTPVPTNDRTPLPIRRPNLSEISSEDPAAPVELIAGSGPELSGETNQLLRCRIRLASLILASGFTLFFVYNLFALDNTLPYATPIWLATGCMALILGVMGGSLCRYCAVSTLKLRLMELAVFGLPAIFFCCYNWLELHRLRLIGNSVPTIELKQLIENPITPWMLLIFNYSILIPNTWKRAAVAIGIFMALPIAIMIYTSYTCNITGAVFNANMITTSFLRLLIAGFTGVVGVATINGLRTAVFEAKQLGQYKLKTLIGSGGMGEVYLAEHSLMKRPVALKLIRPNKANDPQAIARFEREVRATAKLSHWNSIEIYDYGHSADGTFYYVMEYLPGMNIGQIVERYGPLPPERVIYLTEQICAGLGEAHQLGLIHRDIKPGNIFSAYRGGLFDVGKVLDFGLAKPMTQHESVELTAVGSITGSPLYMSPEQAVGDREPDARSDIYSLGAVMYFMLTGRSPFTGDNPIKVMLAHASSPVVPLTRLRPELPADIEAVVLRCLEKNPDDRYASTRELAEALHDCESAGKWNAAKAETWWEAHCELHRDETCQAAMAISESAI